MTTRMRKVWDRGEAAVNGWLSIPSTVTAELVARQDYDLITVDLQHGLIDYQCALTMMQAVNAAERCDRDRAPALARAGHHHEASGRRRLGHPLPDGQHRRPTPRRWSGPATMRRAASAASARPGR